MLPNKLPEAIVFDLDGTLVDSVRGITHALNMMIERRGGERLELSTVRCLISMGAHELLRRALGRLYRSPNEEAKEFRTIYTGVPHGPEDLFPGALACVTSLRARGIKLGVCTNKPQLLAESLMCQTNLLDQFAVLIGGRDDLPPKPAREPLTAALSSLGVTTGTAIFVGDSEVDEQTARAAGVPFVLAEYGYPIGDINRIPCAARFSSFQHLDSLLSRAVST